MAEWQHGLLGCFDNCGICINAYICPCVVFGRAAESVGEDCFKCGFCFMVPIGNIIAWLKIREKVREQKGIEGSTCNDFLVLSFCGVCALVQLAQETEKVVVHYVTHVPGQPPPPPQLQTAMARE